MDEDFTYKDLCDNDGLSQRCREAIWLDKPLTVDQRDHLIALLNMADLISNNDNLYFKTVNYCARGQSKLSY